MLVIRLEMLDGYLEEIRGLNRPFLEQWSGGGADQSRKPTPRANKVPTSDSPPCLAFDLIYPAKCSRRYAPQSKEVRVAILQLAVDKAVTLEQRDQGLMRACFRRRATYLDAVVAFMSHSTGIHEMAEISPRGTAHAKGSHMTESIDSLRK